MSRIRATKFVAQRKRAVLRRWTKTCQPISKTTTVRQAQLRVSRAFHAAKGRIPLAGLKAQADSLDIQRVFTRFTGARGTGARAWATCKDIEPLERVIPDSFREILARNLGSHDRDVTFGARCQEGCGVAPVPDSHFDVHAWGNSSAHPRRHPAWVPHAHVERNVGSLTRRNPRPHSRMGKDMAKDASAWIWLPIIGPC